MAGSVRTGLGLAVCGGVVAAALCVPASAQVTTTLNGPPVQVVPYVAELGVTGLEVKPGTVNPFAGSGSGGGSGGGGDGGDGGGDDGGGGGNVGDSEPLTTMMSTEWGVQAVNNADALGVNPSALAATCVMESGCQNIGGPGSNGNITGAFQMALGTYNEMIARAVAENPNLASQIVQGPAGQNDPATQAIAASEYLKQGAQYLSEQGVSEPTVIDVRGYYNFGPAAGAVLATASPNRSMASALSSYSSSTLASNGITPGETVGQWRAAVAAKLGSAASQSVLT